MFGSLVSLTSSARNLEPSVIPFHYVRERERRFPEEKVSPSHVMLTEDISSENETPLLIGPQTNFSSGSGFVQRPQLIPLKDAVTEIYRFQDRAFILTNSSYRLVSLLLLCYEIRTKRQNRFWVISSSQIIILYTSYSQNTKFILSNFSTDLKNQITYAQTRPSRWKNEKYERY